MYPYLNAPRTAANNGSFLILLAKMKAESNCWRAMFVIRRDGALGFPGGKLEKGENMYQAMHRECLEEIGFDVDSLDIKPDYLCTHVITDHFNSHAFYAVVEEDDLFDIAEHASKFIMDNKCQELTGVCCPKIMDTSVCDIVSRINLTNCGAPTVYEELMHLIYNVLMVE